VHSDQKFFILSCQDGPSSQSPADHPAISSPCCAVLLFLDCLACLSLKAWSTYLHRPPLRHLSCFTSFSHMCIYAHVHSTCAQGWHVEFCVPLFVLQDLKSANILLTEERRAKVGDVVQKPCSFYSSFRLDTVVGMYLH
jgi:hypothetical protein